MIFPKAALEKAHENYRGKKVKIGVVIVTYNRKKELMKALRLFDQQICLPLYIIVVDNASIDGTSEWLDEWGEEKKEYERIVIHMENNAGGSGGFYEGLLRGMSLGADWIWVSDDDAFPELDALEQAEKYLMMKGKYADEISAICGMVINYGKIDINHRKRYYSKGIKIIEECIPEEVYKQETFQLNAFSYVGSIISKQKLKQAGLTNKDYFIWWDDTEHSLRLSKVGKIICVPAIKVHHDIRETERTLNWKTYYGFRNMCDMYRKHMPWICYQYFSIKIRIKIWISKIFGWKKDEIEILNHAYHDARYGHFGLHPVYRPGWRFIEK